RVATPVAGGRPVPPVHRRADGSGVRRGTGSPHRRGPNAPGGRGRPHRRGPGRRCPRQRHRRPRPSPCRGGEPRCSLKDTRRGGHGSRAREGEGSEVTGVSDRRTLGNRYRLVSKLGEGGMAEVYLATDLLLNRAVAVKILHARFAGDREFVERFRREARAAASLSHPNVVNIYDVGEDGDTHYIVLEYVKG